MRVRITKIEGTGINSDHYEVGDVVVADVSEGYDGTLEITMPGTKSDITYLLSPSWYEVI